MVRTVSSSRPASWALLALGVVVGRAEVALDLAAHALHGAGGDDALRGAADAHHEVDGAGVTCAACDGTGDVAVA